MSAPYLENVMGRPYWTIFGKKKEKASFGEWGFRPSSFLEKISVSGWHRMRSTCVKPRCPVLSSSFDEQRFRQVSMRSTCQVSMHLLDPQCTPWSNTVTVVSATFVLQVQHARRVILVIPCALLCASLAMGSPLSPKAVYVFCEHAIEANTDTSHCSECIHLCVWISSPENIGPIYIYIKHVRFGGGGGVPKKRCVFVFSQISAL